MWYVMLILFLDVLCILNIIFKFNSKRKYFNFNLYGIIE